MLLAVEVDEDDSPAAAVPPLLVADDIMPEGLKLAAEWIMCSSVSPHSSSSDNSSC